MKINGKEVKLTYNMTSVRKFEREMGMTIQNALSKGNVGVGVTGVLVWAGMLHQNPLLQLEHVENELTESIKKGELDYDVILTEAVKEVKDSGVLGGLSKN